MSLPRLCRFFYKLRLSPLQKTNINPCHALVTSHLLGRTAAYRWKLSTATNQVNILSRTNFSSASHNGELSENAFEELAGETLERLADQLEDIGDRLTVHPDYDVQYTDGVLTLKLGGENGTYVINKQTPNKQIWLSSPTSGPKRYDYVDGEWIYHHDGHLMLRLLTEELSHKLQSEVTFDKDT